MTNVLHTIIIVLGLPKPVAALIIRMNVILEAMLANKTTFPSPPIALATVQSHTAALSAAETATKTRTAGTIQTRDDARKLVLEDANQLHGYVQQLANASPTEAATIAANAAMTLRKSGSKPKHDLTVTQASAGTVRAVAGNVKGAKAHEWQYSVDSGKSWTAVPATTKASTTITGLLPGVIVQVRHRMVTKNTPGDWSAPVTLAVS